MPVPVRGLEEWAVTAVIGYEVLAKATQALPGPTLPTWTRLNEVQPAVGASLLGALAWHFRRRRS